MTQYSGKVIRKTPVTPTQQAASGVWKLNEQAAAIRNNNWPVPGVPNPISRSVRLRSSASAYFNRTPAIASNRTTWTWSGWAKRGALGSNQQLFTAGTGGSDRTTFLFNTSNAIEFYSVASTTVALYSTAAVFRDPSAWYHIVLLVDTTNATAANRLIIYVNGVQQTLTASTTVAQNSNLFVNSTVAHTIGRESYTGANYLDGYLTEINFIDGQALTPSSFGTTDPLTGVWEPIPYTGTYGTNGFYLNFKDNTSTTTIGYDYSGNSNNWNANNISLTSGSTYDSMLDVPTQWIGYSTTTDTSAVTRGNYCVMNPLDKGSGATLNNGNLRLNNNFTGAPYYSARATFGVASGKWYWEVNCTTVSGTTPSVGIATSQASVANYLGADTYSWAYGLSNGEKYTNASSSAYGASVASGDVVGVALDMDAGTIVFYKNNTSQGTAFTGLTGTIFPAAFAFNNSVLDHNFGQRPFSYTPPTGFKALNTQNLPEPTIVNGSKWMDATLYTGTGSALSITNSGSMQPDWVWIKNRSSASSHILVDSVRGVANVLTAQATSAEQSLPSYVTALNSNGFSVGTGSGGAAVDINQSGQSYVGWQWKANGTPAVTNTAGSITSTVSASTTAGFSVVTYTGTGANATVGHGLGVAPRMIIFKRRSATANWAVYHASIGNTGALALDLTIATDTNVAYFNNTSPTSTVFTVGTGNSINASTSTYVAYAFAQIAGFSAFGSYTGNGSADGPFVYTGFRPRFVLVKASTGAYYWFIYDTSRSTYNQVTSGLYPNDSIAETTDQPMDILSNGFKIRGSGTLANGSGVTYIYACFAENPFKNALAR